MKLQWPVNFQAEMGFHSNDINYRLKLGVCEIIFMFLKEDF